MADILKRREAGTSQGFNGFDLSHEVDFTSAVGQIIPIHYDKLQPQDKIRIKTEMFSRLMPTNSASPISLTEHVDYFFVPYRLLFSLMPSMLADVNDWHSTLMERTSSAAQDYPHFQLDLSFFSAATSNDLSNSYFDPVFGVNDVEDLEGASSLLGSRILLQLLGYGDWSRDYYDSLVNLLKPLDPDDPDSEKVVFASDLARQYDVFPLLAYQCIWQWYYRLDTREELDREAYNCDSHYNEAPVDSILPWSVKYVDVFDNPILKLRYRPWKRDYFTSNEISPLGSVASFSHYREAFGSSEFSHWVRQWLDDSIYNPVTGNYDAAVDSSTLEGDVQNDTGTQVGWRVPSNYASVEDAFGQSTQQHRIAAIIEKLSAIWQQTGKTYKDQMEKQFGIKMANYLSSRPIYIGSQSNKMSMKPIVSDVETSEMAAGTITGYGVVGSDEDKPIEFTAPEHGIFLALFSAVPDAIYRPVGLDFMHTYISRADYPLPVTDELGQRPLFGFEVVNTGIPAKDSVRLGWLARHQELKLKKDMRYTGFDTTLSYWIPARTDEQYSNNLASYYVNPDYLDDIMLVKYSGFEKIDTLSNGFADNAAFDGDPLMHFYKVHCFKSSKQSTYGVPQNFFG